MRRLLGISFLLSLIPMSTAVFAQKSDDHAGLFSFLVASGVREGEDGRDMIGELVARANSLAVKPTFLVALGDVTNSGDGADYDALRQGMKAASGAGITVYAVPGSRDVTCRAQGKERFTRTFGKTYQSFDLNGAHFILLDSTVALHGLGHMDKSEADWMDRDVKKQRSEIPIFVFVYHTAGQQTPTQRPIDNDYDILNRLRGHNVAGLFMGDGRKDAVWSTNTITMLTQRGVREGSFYQVTVSPLIAGVDRLDLNPAVKPVHVSNFAVNTKVKGSLLRVIWDDPDIPFLERRRPAATLAPRAVSDNPDKEKAEYRIDGGAWKPLTKDRRDIWTDTFQTRDIPVVGMHSADVHLTTSSDLSHQDELIFEVQRDEKEATRKWAIDLPAPIQSSPLLDGDTLYVSCLDGKLYAINTANGKRRWNFPSKAAFTASPVLSNGVLFIGSTDKTFYAIETATGHMKWHIDTDSPILATAACAKGTVCVGAPGNIYGFNMETGSRRWALPAAGPFESAAATDGDAFYLGGWDNTCYAIDAVTGAERWHVKIGAAPIESPAKASPCVLNGKVYFAAGDGMLHCLNTASRTELWAKRAPVGEDPIGNNSPTVCGANIVICGNGKLGSIYAYDTESGVVRWHVAIGQTIDSSAVHPAPNARTFAVMGTRGKSVIMDAATGKRLWGYELGPGNVYSTPEYDGVHLYTATMANDVQSINGPGVK